MSNETQEVKSVTEWNELYQKFCETYNANLDTQLPFKPWVPTELITFLKDTQDLSDLDIKFISFENSNFSFASKTLTRAVINNCYFSKADFSNCTMNNSRIINTYASNGNFNGVVATDLDLTGSNLEKATFDNSTLTRPNLKAAKNLYNANFSGAKITDLDFTNQSNRETRIGQVDNEGTTRTKLKFENAKLINPNFSGSEINLFSFHSAYLENANFADCTIFSGNFDNAHLVGANFTKNSANTKNGLKNTTFQNADIRGADFSGQSQNAFTPPFFSGAKYDESTIFPRGVHPENLGMIKTEGVAVIRPEFINKATDTNNVGSVSTVPSVTDTVAGVTDRTPEQYSSLGFSQIDISPTQNWEEAVTARANQPREK